MSYSELNNQEWRQTQRGFDKNQVDKQLQYHGTNIFDEYSHECYPDELLKQKKKIQYERCQEDQRGKNPTVQVKQQKQHQFKHIKKQKLEKSQQEYKQNQDEINQEDQGSKNPTFQVKQSKQGRLKKFKLEKNTNRLFARILIKYIYDNFFQISQGTLDMLSQYDKKKIRCLKNEDLELLLKNPEIGAIGKDFFEKQAVDYIQKSDKLKIENIGEAIRSLKTAFLMCL